MVPFLFLKPFEDIPGVNLYYADLWHDSIGADGLPKPELYVEDQLHPSPAGFAIRTALLQPFFSDQKARQ